jgi:hypothetical protein
MLLYNETLNGETLKARMHLERMDIRALILIFDPKGRLRRLLLRCFFLPLDDTGRYLR